VGVFNVVSQRFIAMYDIAVVVKSTVTGHDASRILRYTSTSPIASTMPQINMHDK